jgi:Ni/Co efflux regulator RcnB
MNAKSIIGALAALSMGFSGMALAQPDHSRGGDDHRRGGDDRHDMPGPRGHDRDHGRPAPPPRHMIHHDGPGAGPDHSYDRGGRLPAQYRGHRCVVDNWREHRLSAPPRGCHWVQTGGDYVLVAITTGIIASILLSH